ISGYGAGGPYEHKKAYDMLIEAEAGLISITGTEGTPSKAGISAADIAAGMYAFSGILTALLTRGQTGEGAMLEISMLEALGEWMGFPMYFSLDGDAPPRAGGSHAAIAPYESFATKDGTVILGIQNEREWARFCEMALEKPEMVADSRFADNSARVANREVLREAITAVFSMLTRDEALARLDRAQIANAAARTMDEFMAHPQLAARKRWRTVDSPSGELPALLPPVTIEGVEPVFGPIPTLGEHTEAILEEIGVNSNR
ncbi:MAG: CoA transferase, partial [Chloroflexi bacterium]|nr:CoA transferase [Chloroflexota bacterium]